MQNPIFSSIDKRSLVEQMGEAYPELKQAKSRVEKILLTEGERFGETLETGLRILDREITSMSGTILPGDIAFRLYDTYGFPLDLTMDYLRDLQFTVDIEGFETEMEAQRKLAKSASKFASSSMSGPVLDFNVDFTGYSENQNESRIAAIIVENVEVDSISEGQDAVIVLDSTPFYAESGGQVGDRGVDEDE